MGEMLNRLRNGFNEMWGGLEKGHRIRIIIAGVLSIVLISSVVFMTSRTKFEPLYYDLSQTSAGQVNKYLKDMGVKTKIDGTTIYVPEGKASELRIQLAADGIINDEGSIPEPATSTSSFYETSEDKKQRYLREKQNDIESGLKALKGVQYASVQLNIYDDSGFVLDENKTDSTAGIIIKMKPGAEPLDEKQVNGIVKYVARSVKGLKPENIEIIDENGRALIEKSDDKNASVGSNMDMTETVKKNVEDSIKKFLQKVFGAANVEVTAAVKLNFNSEVIDSTEYVAPDQEKNAGIVKNMQEIKKEWVDPGASGVPGTDSNTDVNQYVTADTSKAQYSEASNVVNYEINEIKKQIVKEQGNIEALTIAVLINKSSLKADVLANPDALQQDVKELVKYATQGFNTPQAGAADDNISVKIMDFDTSLKDSIASEMQKEATQKRNQSFIMIGTALAALLVLGGAVYLVLRRRKEEEDELALSANPYVAATQADGTPVQDIEFDDKNELKKKLEKFVGQKPEQVAQLLKTWISED